MEMERIDSGKRILGILLLALALMAFAATALGEGPELVSLGGYSEDIIYSGTELDFTFDRVWEGLRVRLERENGTTILDEEYRHAYQFSWYPTQNGVYRLLASGLTDGEWTEMKAIRTFSVQDLPESEQMTIYAPDKVSLGTGFIVYAYDPTWSGYASVEITGKNVTCYSLSSYISSSHQLSHRVKGQDQVERMISPGIYTVSVIWKDYEGKEHTVSKAIEFTGVETAPGMSLELDAAAYVVGDTIHFSGRAGSADRVIIQASMEGAEDIYVQGAVSDGRWNAEMTAAAQGRYTFTMKGYTAAGQPTGIKNGTALVSGTEPLPAPSLTLDDNSDKTQAYFTMKTDTQTSELKWYWSWMVSNGESFQWMTQNVKAKADNTYSDHSWFSYSGKYILTVVYCVDGVYSAPASVEFTREAGDPWPVNGKLPLTFDIPDEWKAGEDASLHWTPDVEGQRVTVYLRRKDNREQAGYGELTGEGDLFFSGRDLLVGDYTCSVSSKADGWTEVSRTIDFKVVENPAQPEAPQFVVQSDVLYVNSEIPFSLGKYYDEYYVYGKGLSGGYFYAREGSGEHTFLRFNTSEDYQLYVVGKINGIWSQEASLVVTIVDPPKAEEITLLDFPDTIASGEGLHFRTLWPSDGSTGETKIGLPGRSNLKSGTIDFKRYPNVVTFDSFSANDMNPNFSRNIPECTTSCI